MLIGKNKILAIILSLVDSNFNQAHNLKIKESDLRGIDWQAMLELAKNNKVLYPLSERLLQEFSLSQSDDLEKIISQGQECFDNFKKTVAFIHSIFDKKGIDFLFVNMIKR